MITKLGKETLETPWYMHVEDTTPITSAQVLRHMKKKHGIDPAVIISPGGTLDVPFYIHDKNSTARNRMLGVFKKALAKNPKADGKDIRGIIKKLETSPTDDLLFIDRDTYKANPAIIGHELGHAVNHTQGNLAPLFRTSRTLPATLLPPMITAGGSVLATLTGNKKIGLTGLGLTALQQGVVLADEYKASKLSDEAMRDLGKPTKSRVLSNAFWKSYVPTAAVMTLVPAQALAVGHLTRQHIMKQGKDRMITKQGQELNQEIYDKYISQYDGMDGAHGRAHIDEVLYNIDSLKPHLTPKQYRLARTAGVLHDVGLTGGRDGHEHRAAEFVDSEVDYLGGNFSPRDISIIRNAVKNHRASTGKPRSVAARVVSDADRIDRNPIRRAYNYHTSKFKEAPDVALQEAAGHIAEKFSEGGPGRRYHFPQTGELYKKYYDPAIAEYHAGDWNALRRRVE